MKAFLSIPFLFYAFLVPFIGLGQDCGLSVADRTAIRERLLQHKETLLLGKTKLEKTMSVTARISFHILASDDGKITLSERKVLDQLCQLNRDFEAVGIKFQLHQINYVHDAGIDDGAELEAKILKTTKDEQSINVFVVESIHRSTSIDGNILGYFDSTNDWIVIDNEEVNDRSIVLTHELGHFFGLLHPYNGWEEEPYNQAKHGSRAPFFSPAGVLTELVDRSNCEEAGDFLCDTPEDYFFAFYDIQCSFEGKVTDPNGMQVDPAELNFMANFLQQCVRSDYFFSDDQISIIKTDLNSKSRAYLKTPLPPVTSPLTVVRPQSPGTNEIVQTHNLVTLSWTGLSAEARYLVEIDRVPTFNIVPQSIITDYNFVELNELAPNASYYWRVRPFNKDNTCTMFSPTRKFTTGRERANIHLPFVQDWTIQPSIFSAGTSFEINVITDRNFLAYLSLANINGKKVFEDEVIFSPTAPSYVFDFEPLNAGIYIIILETEKETIARRIVVTKD